MLHLVLLVRTHPRFLPCSCAYEQEPGDIHGGMHPSAGPGRPGGGRSPWVSCIGHLPTQPASPALVPGCQVLCVVWPTCLF